MQKEILLQLLEQNRKDCTHFCQNITADNINYRLSEHTASVGFMHRHIGETTNLIAQFFGYPTTIENTTIGESDTGVQYDLESNHKHFEDGYNTLEKLVADTPDDAWLEAIETTWFGKISRIKLFSIILFHNAHHCGQISSTITKGRKY